MKTRFDGERQRKKDNQQRSIRTSIKVIFVEKTRDHACWMQWYPSDYYQMMVVRSLLPTKNKRHKSWGTKNHCVADAYPRELSIHIWAFSRPKCYLMLDFWSSEVSDPKTRDRLCRSAQCALPTKPSSRRKPWFESQPKHNLDQATCQSWRGNMGVGDCPILRSIP
jgi:hypothetical protein